MVNEETFKQIYAQFFPHGGESNLENHPAQRPLVAEFPCLNLISLGLGSYLNQQSKPRILWSNKYVFIIQQGSS